jgi:DnaJ-class molecular chaperone
MSIPGYEVSEDLEQCERCKGRGFYGYTVPSNEGVPEYDVDDQPCPDCNPDGNQRDAP